MNIRSLDGTQIDQLARIALDEDIGGGDVTTEALVDPSIHIAAEILSRADCRVAGGAMAAGCFRSHDPSIEIDQRIADGKNAAEGDCILRLSGRAASIITAERTALNFMQRMCGIATMTARFVMETAGFNTRILDTRKTTPGLRVLEKYSVYCGGGENHRFGLFDRVLIKDNHRKLWHEGNADRLDQAVKTARNRFPDRLIEIEVETIEELRVALRGAPDWVLLDNMPPETLRECVALTRGVALSEASGGIDLRNVREVAATGVDAISLGCLTHSAPSVDLSLEWTETLDTSPNRTG